MEVIVSHINLDFDSLASMVAAKKLYPEAKMVLVGAQNRNVRDFISLYQDIFQFEEPKQIEKKDIRRMVIVDTRIADRLGELSEVAKGHHAEIFVFDHHPPTAEDMQTDQDFYEETGATSTILVNLIREKQIKISPLEATLFALGIHEDTGSLTYPTSTYMDAESLAYLLGQKANIEVIHRFLNPTITEAQHKLMMVLLKTANLKNIKGIPVMFAYADTDEYIDNVSVLTHKISDLENIDVVFTFVRMRERVHIIGRSKLDEIDVARVLSYFEGGGHPQAASAVSKETDFSSIERRIIEILKTQAKPPLTAKEIMSEHIHTLDSYISIADANKLLLKYDYQGILVTEDKKLVGIITRKDLAKASTYGLLHAPVKGFMSHRIVSVPSETVLHQVEQIMSEQDIGYILVTENGKNIGIITREDVLKALHGYSYFEESKEAKEPAELTRGEIIERIKSLLPGEIQILLRRLGKLAEQSGYNIYLVGGFVRDILLNQPNLDIDLVVEGDGIDFGERIVQKIGGRLKAHRKFGTAVVILPNGFRIDIASARTEFYEYPAALPKVELSTVKQDLGRRDFTINAMALSLNTSIFGELLDYYGGQRDIAKKHIRVLHNLSFIEDPTRIFRAVRFEQRYQFHIEPETENLAHKAIEMELVGELTNARMRDELILILSEKEPWRSLERLEDIGALKALHPKLVINTGLNLFLKRISKAFSQLDYYFTDHNKKWLVYMMALLSHLTKEEIKMWTFNMKFRKTEAHNIVKGVVDAPKILKALSSSTKIRNSKLYHMLKELPHESLIYVFAKSSQKSVRQRIIYYLANLKDLRLTISGKDLRQAGFKPSPNYQKVLIHVLNAKLDGLIRSKEEELDFAVEKITSLEKGT